MRYILTSVLVLGAFAGALYLRSGGAGADADAEPVTILERAPEVSVAPVAGGMKLVVRYRFAGSCSRAKLVYRHGGEERVLAATTDCGRSLDENADLSGDGYTGAVELTGTLPEGASDVRLVLESEMGTRVARVEL